MAEKIQGAKIICKGGLDSSLNYLELSEQAPGSAVRLLNYEPSLFGGYRRIDGFQPYIEQHPEVDPNNSEGRILCVAIYGERIITARKKIGSDTYSYYFSSANSGWIEQATTYEFDSTGVEKIRWATYNFDGTEKIMFVDGRNPPVIFDGVNWNQVTLSGTGNAEDNAGGDQLIQRPRYITVFMNHIFLSGDKTYPNVVAHSAPLKDWDWKAASGSGQIAAGFMVNQIKPFRETLFVFGRNEIKKITINNTTFVINDVTNNMGCIAPDSVVEINGDLLFLAPDGVRPVSATDRIGDVELASVSKRIHQIMKEFIDGHSLTEVTATVVSAKSQVRFFFSESTDPQGTSEGIVGGLRDSDAGSVWEWGELRGFKVATVCSGYIGRREFIIHGDYDGRVFRQETGNTLDGAPIPHLYQTPFFDFGDTQIRKTIRKLTVFTRPEGALDLAISVTQDWGDIWSILPNGYIVETRGNPSFYGQVRYNEGAVYGGVSSPTMFTNVEGSSFSVQFTFSGLGDGPSHTIQGLVVDFTADGRI